jgi:hypothetical protein
MTKVNHQQSIVNKTFTKHYDSDEWLRCNDYAVDYSLSTKKNSHA